MLKSHRIRRVLIVAAVSALLSSLGTWRVAAWLYRRDLRRRSQATRDNVQFVLRQLREEQDNDAERKPYRLNQIIEALRELARGTDVHLERALAAMTDEYEKDSPQADKRSALVAVIKAYKNNADLLGIVNLLDEGNLEVAQREVERLELRRKKTP